MAALGGCKTALMYENARKRWDEKGADGIPFEELKKLREQQGFSNCSGCSGCSGDGTSG